MILPPFYSTNKSAIFVINNACFGVYKKLKGQQQKRRFYFYLFIKPTKFALYIARYAVHMSFSFSTAC